MRIFNLVFQSTIGGKMLIEFQIYELLLMFLAVPATAGFLATFAMGSK